MKLSRYHIDWPNHIIAFFSALFGILIAFELDGWREERKESELVRIAFENLKKEIQTNKDALHESVNTNLRQIHELQSLQIKMDNQLRFIGTKKEADSINTNFSKIVLIDLSARENMKSPFPVFISMRNIIFPSLQSSAWESAKSTGALNLMDYERVLSLSYVYNHSRIADELNEVRRLWRSADTIRTKAELSNLLNEMEKSHRTLDQELQDYDKFVNILNAME